MTNLLCYRAVKSGACGVPSFMLVDDNHLIWGQDHLNMIQDMMCGWTKSDHSAHPFQQTVNNHSYMCVCVCLCVHGYCKRTVTGSFSLCDMTLCKLFAKNFHVLFVFRPCNVPNSPNKTDCLFLAYYVAHLWSIWLSLCRNNDCKRLVTSSILS